MLSKHFFNKKVLILAIALVLLGIGESAEAMSRRRSRRRVKRAQSRRVVTCPPRGCDPQTTASGDNFNRDFLTILSPREIDSSNLFITGIDGASSNPNDIVQLVDDAVAVWEKAYDPDSLPNLTFNVGWADFGVRDQFQIGVDTGNIDFPTASFSSDTIGLHVCGAPFDPTNFVTDPIADSGSCEESSLNEATILFNSELLKVETSQIDPDNLFRPLIEPPIFEETPTVKLFLDTNPFASFANDTDGTIDEQAPLSEVGLFGTDLREAYNYPLGIDLFTVALHEVGHALGFSTINPATPLDASGEAHIGFGALEGELEFNTRRCLSPNDVNEVLGSGSYAPNSGSFTLLSTDPCGNEPTRRPKDSNGGNPTPQPVPEPSTPIALAIVSGLGWWTGKKRRASHL